MAPLSIGVDARELIGEATGVGRYLGELLRRWLERSDRQTRRLLLYSPEPLGVVIPGDVGEVRVIGRRPGGTWWEQTSLRAAVRRDRPDVFFAPAYTAPLGTRIPLAVTVHDISFVAHPEWFRASEGLRRRWLTRRAAHTASVVLTDSEFSKSEIERHLQVDRGRVRVIRPGVTRREGGRPTPREPIVLFVGSLFNRRRLPDLIAAFARASVDVPRARLVIVGANRTWPPQDLPAVAAAEGVAARTEFLSYVDDDRLVELYGRASVFVFLSEYEGFGLTPLEAMSAGVPPVVLDTAVAREVYAPAAVFVRAGDLSSAADAIRRLLLDREAAGRVLAAAPEVLARYSWERAADETLEAVSSAARGRI
ncbi:MAG TPA: glycosyltransferase family 1 protein [Vicinamibacterales bacterium]|nr:glycosyltransferase family 1 protein [Vicinamibacterales bacterium]